MNATTISPVPVQAESSSLNGYRSSRMGEDEARESTRTPEAYLAQAGLSRRGTYFNETRTGRAGSGDIKSRNTDAASASARANRAVSTNFNDL